MVYCLFSLVLFCTPPRASAQEGRPEKKEHVQGHKTPPDSPRNGAETSGVSSPPDGPPKANTFAVPETTVTGAQENAYKAETATSATKTNTPIRDIPQSISVVTEQVVKSQNAFTLRDALKNVSGLTIAAGEGGRTGDSITLRGFAANSDIYLNQSTGDWHRSALPDTSRVVRRLDPAARSFYATSDDNRNRPR
ncbi:MAG: TonB-dependent receptor plug domain-containing protein, partial [Deltaproteobacteria bacterium]|nr:TonB-dependent receptor plug domain-containing protein [Deltaproteobacteria bacterium]